MENVPRLFVDTSALFSGLWSPQGGAYALLHMGEVGLIQLVASPDVLREIESVVRRKAPHALGLLALTLDRARLEISKPPNPTLMATSESLVPHAGDARIVAAALDASIDFLVTLDRAHLLGNERLLHRIPFPLGTPGDALLWIRARWEKHSP
jgi:predicted nucleic acid-binding protein